MFNTNNIAMGLLLAKNSEKMLKNKQANLPKNWNLRQGLLMSIFPNPTIGMMLHQKEVNKEDQKVTQLSQVKVREATNIIEEINKNPAINLPDSIVKKIKDSGLDIPSFREDVTMKHDLTWKKQVSHFAKELVTNMKEEMQPEPDHVKKETIDDFYNGIGEKTQILLEKKYGLKYIKDFENRDLDYLKAQFKDDTDFKIKDETIDDFFQNLSGLIKE